MAVFDTPIAVLIVIHAPIKREERVNDVYELGFLGWELVDGQGWAIQVPVSSDLYLSEGNLILHHIST